MSTDLTLFGDFEPEPTAVPVVQQKLAQWLVDDIRRALDGRGMNGTSERQAAVEQIVGRPIASLGDLTRAEAIRVLAALAEAPPDVARSSWDARDEPTWIDRL